MGHRVESESEEERYLAQKCPVDGRGSRFVGVWHMLASDRITLWLYTISLSRGK